MQCAVNVYYLIVTEICNNTTKIKLCFRLIAHQTLAPPKYHPHQKILLGRWTLNFPEIASIWDQQLSEKYQTQPELA